MTTNEWLEIIRKGATLAAMRADKFFQCRTLRMDDAVRISEWAMEDCYCIFPTNKEGK